MLFASPRPPRLCVKSIAITQYEATMPQKTFTLTVNQKTIQLKAGIPLSEIVNQFVSRKRLSS